MQRICKNATRQTAGSFDGPDPPTIVLGNNEQHFDFQRWVMNPAGQLINAGSGLALQLGSLGEKTSVVFATTPLPTPPSSSQCWSTFPTYAFQQIAAQTPQTFTTFADTQAAAYIAICQQLGISGYPPFDLRGQYLNAAIPAAAWAGQLVGLPFNTPSSDNIDQVDWDTVRSALANELVQVSAVQGLFQNLLDQFQSCFMSKGFRMAGLIALAGATQSRNELRVKTTELMLSTVRMGVELADGPATVVDFVAAGIDLALAMGEVEEEGFEATVANLWMRLNEDFESVLGAMQLLLANILADPGKIQAIATITHSSNQRSLVVPYYQAASLNLALSAGFDVGVMQMLLPQLYVLEEDLQSSDGDPFTETPDYAKWAQPVVQAPGISNYYRIIQSHDFPTPPPKEIMEDILWKNGVRKDDFFLGRNGWKFDDSGKIQGVNYWKMLMTLVNGTEHKLTVTLNNVQGMLVGPSSRTLSPYSELQILCTGRGSNIEVTVSLAGLHDSNVTGQVNVSQAEAVIRGQTPVFSAGSASTGYTWGRLLAKGASMKKNEPGKALLWFTKQT